MIGRTAYRLELLVLLAAGCLSCSCPAREPNPTPKPKSASKPPALELGGDRPARLRLPRGRAPQHPAPLVVLLHGYGGSGGAEFIRMLHFDELADRESLLLVAPNGTVDRGGARFWNATDACCDFYRDKPDDVAYLAGLIEQIGAAHRVDRDRVYVIGLSNGGFMAHRMGCERADLVRGIVSIAGAGREDARCKPSRPVRVLQLHGDRDGVVAYEGGQLQLRGIPRDRWMSSHPGAEATVAAWARRDRCKGELVADEQRLDLAPDLPGRETRTARYRGCAASSGVALWTLEGGHHVPALDAEAASRIWAFLSAGSR